MFGLLMAAQEKNAGSPAAHDANVVGLALREFSRQAVAEQTRLKRRLEALVDAAIQPLPASERIVLDSPEGMVVVVLASPADALQIAERAGAKAAGLPVCVAVNHGPIKLLEHPGGSPELMGDGIVGAVTLANLATRGRLLISRSFRDAFAEFAPSRADEFSSVGSFTDHNVRSHELLTVDPRAALWRRRRVLIAGALSVLGILGLGLGARYLIIEANRPALVQFGITPRGDVYVDGELQGRSPPLTLLEMAPGHHSIEVRNRPHAPLRLDVTLSPGQEMSVTHAFPVLAPRRDKRADKKEAAKEEEGFFESLRRKLGGE
jgi:hypothetical protein